MSERATLSLIVGSLHYDIMVETDRLPRPDETAIGHRWYPKFGGKGGNQAVAAMPSRMVGAVGADGFGAFLRQQLDAAGVDHQHVETMPTAASGMSVAIMDAQGDYAATIVSGANLSLDPEALAEPRIWTNVGIVVLQNEVPEEVNIAAAREAKARSIPVLLNAAPARALSDEFARLVDVLIVNAVEAEMFGTPPVTDLRTACVAATHLGQRFPTVIVTAGALGLAWASPDEAAMSLPAVKVKAVSSHGAGDCFTGTLATALKDGASLTDACAVAAQAAALHVSRVPTVQSPA